MAPSTPPPPDTSNTATGLTVARPPFQNPPQLQPPNTHLFHSPPPSGFPSNPNPNYSQLAPRPPHYPSHFLYPIPSSGRRFLSRTLPMPAGGPFTRPPYVLPYLDPGQGNPGLVSPNLPQVLLGSGPGSSGNAVMPGVVNGIPVSSSNHQKVGPPSNSISDNNGHNNLRDRNRDDTLTTVRDRKVLINENASLYTLCRSWLRNGYPEETQPQYLDAVKTLPKPLPVAANAVDSSDEVMVDKEGEDEDKESLEQLSEKALLRRHIKRAKRVRSRLREERLQRISRYKTRLALLLPPMVEQQFKNESAEAN